MSFRINKSIQDPGFGIWGEERWAGEQRAGARDFESS
jgi:hypothetical protein